MREQSIDLPQPYPLFHSTAEVVATGTREANLYELSRTLPELEAILPTFYGVIAVHGERAIVLADEGTVRGLDAGGSRIRWSTADIETALRGVGAVHAASVAIIGDVAWLPSPSHGRLDGRRRGVVAGAAVRRVAAVPGDRHDGGPPAAGSHRHHRRMARGQGRPAHGVGP